MNQSDLLPTAHTILEKGCMEFRPFGLDERGEKIRDISGVVIRANVEYLEEYETARRGEESGRAVVRELCRLLNERIRDPAYHVTPVFLTNVWHSYSYEFLSYLREFAERLSGDPRFHFNVGRDKHLSPLIQVLGRPFPVSQIYKMYPHFSQKFAKGSIEVQVGTITDRSAVLRLKFTERSYRQFGRYRKACAEMTCESAKGALMAVPHRIHGLDPAVVRDRSCIVDGAEWCEWEFTWEPDRPAPRGWLRRSTPMRPDEAPRAEKAPADSRRESFSGRFSAPSTCGLDDAGLLSSEHTILERPLMAFRPFGVNPDGTKIRDATGVKVRAFVDYLEEYVARTQSPAAAEPAIQELCRLLNARIADSAYHVTPAFLKNIWNSYSYEFVCYLAEFCKQLSGDSRLPAHAGEEKFISAVIQALGRPFSLRQIYGMFPHFGEKFSSLILGVGSLTDDRAVLSMRYPAAIYAQFGPYRKACAELVCQSAKGALEAVPEKVHRTARARISDLHCVAKGDDHCEWEVVWTRDARGILASLARLFRRAAAGLSARKAPQEDEARPWMAPAPAPADRGREELLSPDHRILERPYMEFRPFGVDEQGRNIRDISGMIVRANVDQLAQSLPGPSGRQAVEELCRLLNARIRDPVYHVTPDFLKNVWNSYSYEFVSYLREFCEQLSGDPQFHYNVGKGQHLSPLIQMLGRPFPVPQIYRMWPHFAQKFAKGSVICEMGPVTDSSAVLRLKFTEGTYRQFGPYRKACARLACEASKGGISMVPLRVHNLPLATVTDRTCIVNGDEWCEWEVTWAPQRRPAQVWPVWGLLAGGAAFVYLQLAHSEVGLLESLIIGLLPPIVAWFATTHRLQREARMREALIHEQVEFVESRHEELREAYLDQEQIHVELRRKVNQLTTMHRTGLLFSATLDRETLVQNVLETIVRELGYDRAMISFYDPGRRVSYGARVLGVPKDAAALAYAHEIPVHDPATLEGEVLLNGNAVLITDLRQVWERVHPLNRELAIATQAKSLISVPLKVKDVIIGALTVDRAQEHSLTSEDLDLMVTLASQVAIALDNTDAYRQIEELNLSLEAKVRERTLELEKADRLRSLFLSHVSHELRTPLTSIKGFVENMLAGLAGPLSDKQSIYLERIGVNVARLIRMIAELLDRSRIESGKMDLLPSEVDLKKCVSEVVEQLRAFAVSKGQQLEEHLPSDGLMVWADGDRVVQILTNLLHNAIKFTPEGGRIAVRVQTDAPNLVRVSVADSGPGIPPEALAKIFDPFFRVGQEHRGSPKGLGLGLSIAKTLVELHGGSITVKSQPGRGCDFVFTLPLSPAWKARQSRRGMAAKQILVVDDDADIRQLLLDWLTSQGYAAETARDGAQALAALQSGRFDGVILDMGLPDLDGLEVLRRLREWNHSIPVLVVTASDAKERAVRAVSLGAQAYLLKPFDLRHMEELADYWFRRA